LAILYFKEILSIEVSLSASCSVASQKRNWNGQNRGLRGSRQLHPLVSISTSAQGRLPFHRLKQFEVGDDGMAIPRQQPDDAQLMQFVQGMSILASMGHCVQPDAVHLAQLVDKLMARDMAVSAEHESMAALNWVDF
jgi:hypothetical protein